MATPCELDFNNAMSADVEQYFQVANLDARERVSLYRLAHDVAVSGFGSRQTLYERFFFGPPHLMHAAYFGPVSLRNRSHHHYHAWGRWRAARHDSQQL